VSARIIVVTGVAGAGKSAIGQLLASELRSKAQMLASQYADLEQPANAIAIDVAIAPCRRAQQVVGALFPARAKAR
jgi:gluconate kinase